MAHRLLAITHFPTSNEQMPAKGSQAIAVTLKQLGIKHIFGIVGIPVIEVAEACIAEGIEFISFRNEQSAVYAASVYGYMTGKPGVCLVVGGPGVIHALSGVENAIANRFPLLLLAGSSETSQKGLGAFQQLDQVSVLRGIGAKFSEQPDSIVSLPRLVEQAYRVSFYGKPGATYIDLPANLIQSTFDAQIQEVLPPWPSPRTLGDPQRVTAAALLVKEARFPLLIVGKGAAYGRAEASIRRLQRQTSLGFLPTPMGKGVIPDSSAENLSAARSQALKHADVVVVLGARLNWILHYGMAPKFKADAKFIQVDNVGEELRGTGLGIQGDVGLVSEQLAKELEGWRAPNFPAVVLEKRKINETKNAEMELEVRGPLKYHPVYRIIRETLAKLTDRKIIYVSEGANTMDASRTSFSVEEPRTRLDAGTNATMGVGLGYAISAKVAEPEALVVAIEGDSAFGFSGMEIETAVRSKLPMVIYVMNNSGVYHGVDPAMYNAPNEPLPSTALSLNTQYHKLAESLGGEGYLATTLDDVRRATVEAVQSNHVALINVIIDPAKDKKLEFGWMASAKL